MPRFFQSSKIVGAAPGKLEFTGKQRMDRVRIRTFFYQEHQVDEAEVQASDLAEFLARPRAKPGVLWLNVDGLHDLSVLQQLGDSFQIHALALEDVTHPNQRPKAEEYEGLLFLVMRMMRFDAERVRVGSEQLSLVLLPGVVLSFQEVPGDVFDNVRERIRNGKGRIRRMESDYLTYALLDAVVDSTFLVLEGLGERIEALEDQLTNSPSEDLLRQIHSLKRELTVVRRSVWPLRELLSSLLRDESKLISKETRFFLRDVYDHTVQVVDSIELYRDVLSGLQDLYLSTVGHRMNEVMKVLTIIATMFVPLTFLAGIYGMNFEYMPELKWQHSYEVFWGVTIAMSLAMLYFFRRKKWL